MSLIFKWSFEISTFFRSTEGTCVWYYVVNTIVKWGFDSQLLSNISSTMLLDFCHNVPRTISYNNFTQLKIFLVYNFLIFQTKILVYNFLIIFKYDKNYINFWYIYIKYNIHIWSIYQNCHFYHLSFLSWSRAMVYLISLWACWETYIDFITSSDYKTICHKYQAEFCPPNLYY